MEELGEDHKIDTLIKNELSHDEMVGTPIDTNEKSLEKAPEIHEEDKGIESLAMTHLLNNKLDEITADGKELASGIHRVDQKIETSSKRHSMDGEIEDIETDMELRGQKQDDSSSTHSSTFSSKNSIDTLTCEPDIQMEDQEKGNSINDTILNPIATDIEIRGQEEDSSTDSSTSSSRSRLSNSENSVYAHNVEPDIQKEDQEKYNSINKPTINSTSEEGEIFDYVKDKKPSSEIITDDHKSGEKMELEMHHVQKESENEASMDLKPNDFSHSTSVEDGEKIDNDLNDRQGVIETSSSEQTGDNSIDNDTSSSPIRVSNSENSVDAHNVKPDIQKEDQEKYNSINKPTINSTSEAGEIFDYVKDKKPSSEMITDNHESSEKMEMEMHHVQKESENEATMDMKPKEFSHTTSVEDGEKIGDDLNDRQGVTETSSSEQTGDNSTHNNISSSPIQVSSSENSVDAHNVEPYIQKEDQEKYNSIDKPRINSTSEEGEIFDYVKDKKPSSEMITDNHKSGENMEMEMHHVPKESENEATMDMKPKDFSHTTSVEDGEKIGDDFNDRQGVSETSSFEQTGDNSTHNNTSSSPIPVSNSENSVDAHNVEPCIQKEDQEKYNSINKPTINSTSEEGEIFDYVKDKKPSSEMITDNNQSGEKMEMETHHVQKEYENEASMAMKPKDFSHTTSIEDGENIGDDLNDRQGVTETSSSEQRGDNSADNDTSSSPIGISNSENSVDAHNVKPDIQKEDQEKYNSINKPTINSTSEAGEIFDYVKDKKPSSEMMEMEMHHVQKESENEATMDMKPKEFSHTTSVEDGEKIGDDLNDRQGVTETSSSEQTGDNSTHNNISSSPIQVSSSENSVDAHNVEPYIQKEDQEKYNSIDKPRINSTSEEGEIFDYVKDKKPSSEMITDNHKSGDNMEMEMHHVQKESENEATMDMKPKDFSHTTSVEDGEKIGDDFNDRQGVSETSFFEQTGDNSTHNNTSSSPIPVSNSENSVDAHNVEPCIQKEDQEKYNSINKPTINSTSEEGEIFDYVKDKKPSSEMITDNNQSGEKMEMETHHVQKEYENEASMAMKPKDFSHTTSIEDGENIGDDLNDRQGVSETSSSEQRGDNSADNDTSSSPIGISNFENSVDAHNVKPDIQKEDQEKYNSINKPTINSTSEAGEIFDYVKDKKPSSDMITDNYKSGEKMEMEMHHVQKKSENEASMDMKPKDVSHTTSVEDVEKIGDDLNDRQGVTETSSSEQTGDNSTHNNTSSSPIRVPNSENSVDAHIVEPDIQKEDHEKYNSINKPTINSTSEEGEILDNLNDKEDTKPSSELIRVNHHFQKKEMEESKEEASMDMEPKDFSPATSVKDGEKIGDDLNDQQGITENSFSEQIRDIETDSKDNTSSNEEEDSIIYHEIQEPEVEANSAAWSGKAAALTNFVKVKSLLAVSNVFKRISRNVDEPNDLNDKDKDLNGKDKNVMEEVTSSEGKIQLASQTTLEKRRWRALSFIGISREKDQGNKAEVGLESLESIAIKGRVVLYTRLWCQNCKEARLFLRKRRLRYYEINIDVYPSRKLELEKITGSSNVPAVFFNQVHIGGLNELKALADSGQLKEKIEYVTIEGPSPKAPLPPFSGEDDVSSSGVVDELAVIVRNMKDSIVVKDRYYKFRRITNCFLGSEAVDFLTEDQYLEREEAIEFARKLSKELFFRHVFDENIFEDGNHLYRFLDQDPVISQCQNIPRGIIQLKRQPLVQLSYRLKCLLYAIIDAYTSEDGKRVDYRTIHGSEEFARYLRIAEELQRVDISRMVKEERLAFFINLYNLMAIHAILVWGHPEGALDRRRLLNDFKYVIGGCAYSLSDIHNGILRSNQRPPYTLARPFGITDKRFKACLPYPEPLVHFALVSGNRSAPPLRCYSPKNIDVELSEAARDFLQSGAFVLDLDSMTVSVTKILKWYSVDFGKNEVEVLKHASNYLEAEKTQTLLDLLDSTQLKVVYQPYDWRLNS